MIQFMWHGKKPAATHSHMHIALAYINFSVFIDVFK